MSLPRSHALRGNAYLHRSAVQDAERPAMHSHAERGNEERRAWERGKYAPKERQIMSLIRFLIRVIRKIRDSRF